MDADTYKMIIENKFIAMIGIMLITWLFFKISKMLLNFSKNGKRIIKENYIHENKNLTIKSSLKFAYNIYKLVKDYENLQTLFSKILGDNISFGLDTEYYRGITYKGEICLFQISIPGYNNQHQLDIYIVDIILIKQELLQKYNNIDKLKETLKFVFENPKIEKIIHCTTNDSEWIYQDFDIILHNAADVNFVKPYSQIKSSNVLPLKTLLQFACANKVKPLHFISTVAVFNSPERYKFSPIKESDKLIAGQQIFSGYAQSKWVSEELLRRASLEKNLAITCYRPGLVTGDSRSGYAHTDDFLCRFIKGCLQMKTFPLVHMEIDMSPVDFVSKAIVTILEKSQEHLNKFNAFHLVNPKPIKLPNFFSWLKQYGFEIEPLDLQEWLKFARNELAKDNALYPVMPFLTQANDTTSMTILELFDGRQLDYDFSNTKVFLQKENISCPLITEKLLKIYINFFIKSGFFKGLTSKKQYNCNMEGASEC